MFEALSVNMELFSTVEASSKTYVNVRDSNTPMMIRARQLCLDMWNIYEPYADEHFRTEFARDFGARFWEMDLACTLLGFGKGIECPKPGPDIKVDSSVWIEAISPTQGHEGSRDRVPDIVTGTTMRVNKDPIILRYTASIEEKHRKYLGYIEKGIIKKDEPYIIALNSSQIPGADLELPMPRIVSALLSIGSQYVEFDRESGDVVGDGYHHQEAVKKSNGADVPIDMFHNPDYCGISAILYSNSDCFNRAEKNGSGYIIVHNPRALNPIDVGFLGVGKEAVTAIESEKYSISWVNHESA